MLTKLLDVEGKAGELLYTRSRYIGICEIPRQMELDPLFPKLAQSKAVVPEHSETTHKSDGIPRPPRPGLVLSLKKKMALGGRKELSRECEGEHEEVE